MPQNTSRSNIEDHTNKLQYIKRKTLETRSNIGTITNTRQMNIANQLQRDYI